MTLIEVPDVDDVTPLNERTVMAMAIDAAAEVDRQDFLARDRKFGGTHILPGGPDHARFAVLSEEVGEVARELNEALIRAARGDAGWDRKALQKELIQVAACAVAWAAAIEEGR